MEAPLQKSSLSGRVYSFWTQFFKQIWRYSKLFCFQSTGKQLNPKYSNVSHSLAAPQTCKYSKIDFYQIFKIVLKAQLPPARDQDQRIPDNVPEKVFKPRTLNICKNKLHMDCYNFFQQCKDYFATFKFQAHN